MSEKRSPRTREYSKYVLAFGQTRYTSGSYRRIADLYDAVSAYCREVQEKGVSPADVPVVIQVERSLEHGT